MTKRFPGAYVLSHLLACAFPKIRRTSFQLVRVGSTTVDLDSARLN
jgi:hypothetical protein